MAASAPPPLAPSPVRRQALQGYDDFDGKPMRMEPSAPPAPWLLAQLGKPAWVPSRWVVFSPMAFVACVTLLVWELKENAANADVEGARTSACFYRVVVRETLYCAASLKENPLLGPTSSTLRDVGAVSGDRIVQHEEAWRLFTGVWLHGGLAHLAVNMLALLGLGCHLERVHGSVRIGIIYLCSGLFGSMATAIFTPSSISVGASGAIFGLIGAVVGDICMNWDMYSRPFRSLCWVCLVAAIQLLIGTMPWLDNFAHVFGFFMGFLSSVCLLTRLNKGARCWHTCSRRCFRTMAGALVFVSFLVAVALLYGIGGVDVVELCPQCSQISCKEFPWGCEAHEGRCWWTCEHESPGRCQGEAVWPHGAGSREGYVDLRCPRPGNGAEVVRVEPVDLTHWGTEFLGVLCKDHC